MDMDTGAEGPSGLRRWFRSRSNWVLLGFLGIAGFFLITEHTAHVFGALPFVLLLACPLLHLFMHGGHSGHQGHRAQGSSQDDAQPDEHAAHTGDAGYAKSPGTGGDRTQYPRGGSR